MLIDTIIDYLARFSVKGLSAFTAAWKKRDYLANSQISVMSGSQQHRGIAHGINNQGHLKVFSKDGVPWVFSSGDATIIK